MSSGTTRRSPTRPDASPHTRRTPMLTTDLDPRLRLKPECFQVTGSFKARGAFNAILRLKERQAPVRGVIAVSAGNHAQAVGLAARAVDLPAAILVREVDTPDKGGATDARVDYVHPAGVA